MIQEIEGDLLCFPANILCHQTNYYGVMDGGIAAAIRYLERCCTAQSSPVRDILQTASVNVILEHRRY